MHNMSEPAVHQHTAPTGFIRKYVFSLDHKVIGEQYYGLALVAVYIGLVLSWVMRIHLAWPNAAIPGLQLLSKTGAPGGVLTPEYYLQLMTMHGTIMVFFVLTTAPFAGFGNYFLPIQVGAEDMPFPHLNMMSFWVTFVAFCVADLGVLRATGATALGLDGLRASERPGSSCRTRTRDRPDAVGRLDRLFCVGQLLGSLNFISTTLDMRCKGMSLMRLPLSHVGLVHYLLHRPHGFRSPDAGVHSADPRSRCRYEFLHASNLVVNDQLQPHAGGSTLLWQHLFWFFGHPEVYIAIVPAMGMVSHMLITNMRRPLLSRRVIIYSHGGIAFLSYMVYGHHMFVSGMNPFSSLAFSFPTLVITIPATDHRVDLDRQLYGSKLRINTRFAVRPGLHLDVRQRRRERLLPGAAFASTSCCMPRISWSATSTW